jgi:ubiquinone/menaquinone biosynthesis C-methylase UbiE
VQVTGLDSDPEILALARQKSARAGVDVVFDSGTAAVLPWPDTAFDCGLSCLLISLPGTDDRRRAVREADRVLRRGGELHRADFRPPPIRWARWVAPRERRFEPIVGNLGGLLPIVLREARVRKRRGRASACDFVWYALDCVRQQASLAGCRAAA